MSVAKDISDEKNFPLYQIANSDQIVGFYHPAYSTDINDYHPYEFQDIEINNIIYMSKSIALGSIFYGVRVRVSRFPN